MTRLYPLLPWALCVLGAVCCLSACSDFGAAEGSDLVSDRCIEREMFRECMAALPAGPSRTHYNDWSEVVDSCRQYAWTLRARSSVPPECQ